MGFNVPDGAHKGKSVVRKILDAPIQGFKALTGSLRSTRPRGPKPVNVRGERSDLPLYKRPRVSQDRAERKAKANGMAKAALVDDLPASMEGLSRQQRRHMLRKGLLHRYHGGE